MAAATKLTPAARPAERTNAFCIEFLRFQPGTAISGMETLLERTHPGSLIYTVQRSGAQRTSCHAGPIRTPLGGFVTDRSPCLNASTQHDPVDACSRHTIRILLETELRRIL